VTPEVIDDLRTLIPLAPLHQPYNIGAIEAVAERLPDVQQVACFDTSFHRGHSPVAELIPLPKDLRDSGVQRYGFHGLSYEYIASVLPDGGARDCRRQGDRRPPWQRGKHVRAPGAEECGQHARLHGAGRALYGDSPGVGRSGSDPPSVPDGRPVGHRSGKDPLQEVGMLGVSGISNDMRDLLDNPDPGARLAVDYFVYHAAKQVGALAAALGGVDALVFTAGIGEHSAEIRRRICEASAWLGVTLDPAANQKTWTQDHDFRQQGIGLGRSHQRRGDDRPAHRNTAGHFRRPPAGGHSWSVT
jgi:acetate kinase